MKILILTTLFALNAFAANEQYTIKKENLSTKNFDYTLEYPVFNKKAVPAAQAINENLLKTIKQYACDAEDMQDKDKDYSYNAESAPVAINSKYVTVSFSEQDDCGGVHPNNSFRHLTYDAKTGEQVDFAKEVPAQNLPDNATDEDFANWEKYNKALATIIYKHLSKDDLDTLNEIVEQSKGSTPTEADIIEELSGHSPEITGLANDKKVMIDTFPAHVIAVATVSVAVDYAEVKELFAKNSKTAEWFE